MKTIFALETDSGGRVEISTELGSGLVHIRAYSVDLNLDAVEIFQTQFELAQGLAGPDEAEEPPINYEIPEDFGVGHHDLLREQPAFYNDPTNF